MYKGNRSRRRKPIHIGSRPSSRSKRDTRISRVNYNRSVPTMIIKTEMPFEEKKEVLEESNPLFQEITDILSNKSMVEESQEVEPNIFDLDEKQFTIPTKTDDAKIFVQEKQLDMVCKPDPMSNKIICEGLLTKSQLDEMNKYIPQTELTYIKMDPLEVDKNELKLEPYFKNKNVLNLEEDLILDLKPYQEQNFEPSFYDKLKTTFKQFFKFE
jgi:hypothetical protein